MFGLLIYLVIDLVSLIATHLSKSNDIEVLSESLYRSSTSQKNSMYFVCHYFTEIYWEFKKHLLPRIYSLHTHKPSQCHLITRLRQRIIDTNTYKECRLQNISCVKLPSLKNTAALWPCLFEYTPNYCCHQSSGNHVCLLFCVEIDVFLWAMNIEKF